MVLSWGSPSPSQISGPGRGIQPQGRDHTGNRPQTGWPGPNISQAALQPGEGPTQELAQSSGHAGIKASGEKTRDHHRSAATEGGRTGARAMSPRSGVRGALGAVCAPRPADDPQNTADVDG